VKGVDVAHRSLASGIAERVESVSVPKAVATFLVAGLVVFTTVGLGLALALRQTATSAATDEASIVTKIVATEVIGPVLSDKALVLGPEQAALDRVVRQRVLGNRIMRVKIWDATGRIVYSDDLSLIGKRFPVRSAELAVLNAGGMSSDVSSLSLAEDRDESQFGPLLQVFLGIRTPSGHRLMFETYQPYQGINDSSRRLWLTSLPTLLWGLLLLYLVQAPLAYRMALRLKRSQDEREALLIASLAASDRERATIAADLHDGVVQGLTGASMSLSVAATRVRECDRDAARVMTDTAVDLRRWMRELRSLVVTITPPALHAQGLATSIADLAAILELRGLVVTVDVTGTMELDETTETLVFRAVQEAVRNVVRHADATAVSLSVARHTMAGSGADVLVLRVRDDGCGFDTGHQARGRGSVGLELLSMLVASQGGTLVVDASLGRGTELVLRVPVTSASQQPTGSLEALPVLTGAQP
jgi:two-component system NarL family sensor kinase